MKYKNSVHPTKEQMEGFLEGDNEAPIAMINLLKFKEKAEYEDGRDTELTGEQAYAIYSDCLLYTSPSPRDKRQSRMPSSA